MQKARNSFLAVQNLNADLPDYSYRSALIGSTLAARIAG
jgi:hypothetical protein